MTWSWVGFVSPNPESPIVLTEGKKTKTKPSEPWGTEENYLNTKQADLTAGEKMASFSAACRRVSSYQDVLCGCLTSRHIRKYTSFQVIKSLLFVVAILRK